MRRIRRSAPKFVYTLGTLHGTVVAVSPTARHRSESLRGGETMLVADAQREVRTVFVGSFWGQLVSSVLWLASAALGTWSTPRAAILMLVLCGFFIFPLSQLMLRLSGRPASLPRGNPLG